MGDRFLDNFAIGQRIQKQLAILLALDARIEHDDDARITGSPDQPPKPLAEFCHRLRQLVITKRIATRQPDRLEPSLQQRLVRNAEGQFRDDHVLKRIAGYVDALPETVGAEQHSAFGPFELFQQFITARLFGLRKEPHVLLASHGVRSVPICRIAA